MSLTKIAPNSTFKLSVTVTEGVTPVTGAQVTVTLYGPDGVAFTGAEMTNDGAGLYSYEAPASSIPTPGVYTAEFTSINGTTEGRERLRFLVSY